MQAMMRFMAYIVLVIFRLIFVIASFEKNRESYSLMAQ